MTIRVRHLIKASGLLIAALLMVAILSLTSVTHAAGGGWSVLASPNASPTSNTLQSVAAVSTHIVWAVGYDLKGTTKSTLVKQTLIERFNGTSWSITASPNSGKGDNVLNGVAAITATDAWAVGYSTNGALVLHYNGRNWRVFSAPLACQLNAVTAVSATNVWAVGTMAGRACAEHFDGADWHLVQMPVMGTADNTLLSVTAISAADMWAVGSYCLGNGCDRGGGIFQTMILHFDGSRWSVAASPNPGTLTNHLSAVFAIAANDVWAVGSEGNDPQTGTPMILRFDGYSWFQVVGPDVKGNSSLSGITGVSPTDITAIGSTSASATSGSQTLITHFDGNAWSVVASPSPGIHNALNGIAHVAGANPGNAQYWAVGTYDNNVPLETLAERDI